MKPNRRQTVLAALLLALPLVAVLAPSPAATAATKPLTIKVLNHNTDHVYSAFSAAKARMDGFRPHFVTLQEICGKWADNFRQNFPQYTVAWHERRSSHPDCKGGRIGELAIYTGGPRSSVNRRFALNFDTAGETQNFGMACVATRIGGVRFRACSTHLAARANQANRLEQTRKIASLTSAWRKKGISVIVAGDFNTGPGKQEMNRIWAKRVGGRGGFYDAGQLRCKCRGGVGATTDSGRHIDWVNFSSNRWHFSMTGKVTVVPTASGHHMLQTWARVKR